jgi:hypothetical protein
MDQLRTVPGYTVLLVNGGILINSPRGTPSFGCESGPKTYWAL